MDVLAGLTHCRECVCEFATSHVGNTHSAVQWYNTT